MVRKDRSCSGMIPVVLIGVLPYGLGEMLKESIQPLLERLH